VNSACYIFILRTREWIVILLKTVLHAPTVTNCM
jgi:hypothetical protein